MIEKLKEARGLLLTLAVIVVLLRVVLWAIEPLVPYLVVGFVIISLFGCCITAARNYNQTMDFLPLFIFAAFGFGLVAAVAWVRWASQRRADHFRRTYELAFPRNMSHDGR